MQAWVQMMFSRSIDFPDLRCEYCGGVTDWLVSTKEVETMDLARVLPEDYSLDQRGRRDFFICESCWRYEGLFPVGITEAEIASMCSYRDEITQENILTIQRFLPNHRASEKCFSSLSLALDQARSLSSDMNDEANELIANVEELIEKSLKIMDQFISRSKA